MSLNLLLFPQRLRALCIVLILGLLCVPPGGAQEAAAEHVLSYKNDRRPEVPWSVHVIRIPRSRTNLQLHAIHANGGALGLGQLSSQVKNADREFGRPVAAINGDFYQRSGTLAGLPRGMQVMDSELLAPPSGRTTFWIDIAGDPHIGGVTATFQVSTTNGISLPMNFNTTRRYRDVVLYTPAWGGSTRAAGGRELIMDPITPQMPIRPSRFYRVRVKEIRESGNSRIPEDKMVLSIAPALLGSFRGVQVGSELTISTATTPSLKGARAAIGGGPTLVRDGRVVRVGTDDDSYETSSMDERHPRSAVGWNDDYFFLVQVDGRRWNLSIGMTLRELSNYLVRLGCTDAMNLDGGGSATIWYKDRVVNHPCDGYERPVANSLVVFDTSAR